MYNVALIALLCSHVSAILISLSDTQFEFDLDIDGREAMINSLRLDCAATMRSFLRLAESSEQLCNHIYIQSIYRRVF